MFLILGTLRGFNVTMQALRRNEWRGKTAPPLGHDPEGKTLGILGMGGIGRNLKKKAEAFGMTVQYHNRSKLSEELAGGAKYVSFDELLATSDVLSLNLPLNVSLDLRTKNETLIDHGAEKHSSHHFDERIRKDEEGNRHCQYGSRGCYGRGRTRKSPR
jgi:lactate dehydrogenase-like 2-hydroxyacid dehydrogenase